MTLGRIPDRFKSMPSVSHLCTLVCCFTWSTLIKSSNNSLVGCRTNPAHKGHGKWRRVTSFIAHMAKNSVLECRSWVRAQLLVLILLSPFSWAVMSYSLLTSSSSPTLTANNDNNSDSDNDNYDNNDCCFQMRLLLVLSIGFCPFSVHSATQHYWY